MFPRQLFLILFLLAVSINAPLAVAEELEASMADGKVVCPAGTQKIGGAPQDEYCEKLSSGLKPVRHGPFRSYFRDGSKRIDGTFNLGEPDGTFIIYHRDGKVKDKATYVNGKLYGEHISYFKSGEMEVREIFQDGKLNGHKESYFENGSPRFDGGFKDGAANGIFVLFYDNGKRKTQGFFKMGKRSGTWTNFYRGGERKSEGEYLNGKSDGIWTSYRVDGTVSGILKYKNGRIVKRYKGERRNTQEARAIALKSEYTRQEERRFSALNKKMQNRSKEPFKNDEEEEDQKRSHLKNSSKSGFSLRGLMGGVVTPERGSSHSSEEE